MAQQLAHRALEVPPMHDRVEHPMIEKEFGSLKSFRQILPEGLLDDARPRESDDGARLTRMADLSEDRARPRLRLRSRRIRP